MIKIKGEIEIPEAGIKRQVERLLKIVR